MECIIANYDKEEDYHSYEEIKQEVFTRACHARSVDRSIVQTEGMMLRIHPIIFLYMIDHT